VVMRQRDWKVREDDCIDWLKRKVNVQFVEGSSDDEFE